MISKIHRTRRLKQAIIYNENKVKSKAADFLDAGFYISDPQDLTFDQKLERLQNRALLNQRAKNTTVLFTLGFDNTDKLSPQTLKRVAADFLKSVGLVNHPYLLYEHFDTAAQHVHIISTLIGTDGKRFPNNLLSLPFIYSVSRAISTRYGLRLGNPLNLQDSQSQKIQSGAPVLTKTLIIRRAVEKVLSGYKFSSLSEYNALLKLFGVRVSAGRKDSRLFSFGGLIYSCQDISGKSPGKPVKASRINPNATLKALNLKFDQLKSDQIQQMTRLKNTIDLCVINSGTSLSALARALKASGVEIHIIQNMEAQQARLTYIDKRTKCAFDAQKLGEGYSLIGLNQKCKKGSDPILKRDNLSSPALIDPRADTDLFQLYFSASPKSSGREMLLADLMAAQTDYSALPYALSGPKKKRRKRRTTHL